MEPNKFRESREAINRLCEDIHVLIDQKAVEASKERYTKVNERLDALIPQAEGEIQERSVKNLGAKLKALSTRISKLKPKKTASRQGPADRIVWDEKRVADLSILFLSKVFHNMGDDEKAVVSFGTSGKGIRPNYHVQYGNGETTTFNGSNHKPSVKQISGSSGKLSSPFGRQLIETILRENQ